MVEPAEAVHEAYRTGRGGFRLRARWTVERLAQGLYQVVVTEIPYQVAKSRLVERIADLVVNKKLPLLEDVRDESTEDVRLILVPRSRNVEPEVLMEHLFRMTDLEVRASLNMNVLDAQGVPAVLDLPAVLRAFLDHRLVVLLRRTRHRLAQIAHRLEVLEGYLVAYLNIDEVIHIIRTEDDAKATLIARFALTDVQAEAILNMRLRSLRKLEEIEIRGEHDRLTAEQAGLEALLADEGLQRDHLRQDIADIDAKFGGKTALGRRRTEIAGAPAPIDLDATALVEREPVTVLLSEKGWIRAVRGHAVEPSEIRYKEGDGHGFALRAETTDRLLLLASDGRFFTLNTDRLPRGRGFGEPVRLMVDLAADAEVVALLIFEEAAQLLLVASDGRGFRVGQSDVVAQTKAGRQVLNPGAGARAALCVAAEGDTVAVTGTHRRLLCFPLDEVPQMTRGRGVILMKLAGGEIADAQVFLAAAGLQWISGGRTFTENDLAPYLGRRGGTGRLPPKGFPKSNRFS